MIHRMVRGECFHFLGARRESLARSAGISAARSKEQSKRPVP